MSSGAFRKIGTTNVNLPIQFSRYCLPPDPLEPVYCETRSVHSPGKVTIGTNTAGTFPPRRSVDVQVMTYTRGGVLCPNERALWYHVWLPINSEMRGQPGVAI
jgi:hypothetical protein